MQMRGDITRLCNHLFISRWQVCRCNYHRAGTTGRVAMTWITANHCPSPLPPKFHLQVNSLHLGAPGQRDLQYPAPCTLPCWRVSSPQQAKRGSCLPIWNGHFHRDHVCGPKQWDLLLPGYCQCLQSQSSGWAAHEWSMMMGQPWPQFLGLSRNEKWPMQIKGWMMQMLTQDAVSHTGCCSIGPDNFM